MTYFPTTRIKAANSPSIDAFGRWRTSNPFTIFDSKQLHDSGSSLWSTKLINGASASYEQDKAATELFVTSTSGSKAIKQTKQRFYYQPGKSIICFTTFNLNGNVPGIVKRSGYFDDENGVFLELYGNEIYFTIRSKTSGVPIDTKISQSAWNVDKLDGTGISAKTIDFSKTQIFLIDLQWLGVGRVRLGFDIDGEVLPCHEFLHANIDEEVYMSTPNLPIRYEIDNFGGINSSSIEQICCSISSEGGFEAHGEIRTVDRGSFALITSEGKTVPIVSFRLKTTHLGTTIIPLSVDLLATTNTNFRWGIYKNPIFGTDNANWLNVNESAIEYDISRTQNNIITGGILVQGGYLAAGGSQGNQATSNFVQESFTLGSVLGTTIDGEQDELVLAVEAISTGSATFYSSITWKELK
jgi:hypothetical protein